MIDSFQLTLLPDGKGEVVPGSGFDIGLDPNLFEWVSLPDVSWTFDRRNAQVLITYSYLYQGMHFSSSHVFRLHVTSGGHLKGTRAVSVLQGGALALSIQYDEDWTLLNTETVVSVVGLTQSAAEAAITNAGFRIGTVTNVRSNTVPVGNVVSQVPAGGSQAPSGTEISLIISLGPHDMETVVNVVGLVQSAAEAAITNAGFRIGTVTNVRSDTVPVGKIVSQVPAGSSLALSGTEISLYVSLGPHERPHQTVMLPGNVPFELTSIPLGNFTMGAYSGEQGSAVDELPQHQVTLSSGFWIGTYEVTKAQWVAVMGTIPWSGQASVLDEPDSAAIYISWSDAQAFLSALNKLTGKSFRLPSEAEWEYVCRAGTTTRFYWGDDPDCSEIDNYAWYYSNTAGVGKNYAHLVGQKFPNAWGLYDMSGNVWEWCQDWYHGGYGGAPADGSAWEAPITSYHVQRGGGWSYGSGEDSRSAIRAYWNPIDRYPNFGFRVVLQ
ncbi:MAG: SUMF1/EgtB/PvdO family nonheme iron enzyme [Candidatus Hydrogenedentes bacterium]|nr:SUMF1/EgtB/PvdO family nonheme iron enzyme [Candidatus Hydrogenedentota bacterium]